MSMDLILAHGRFFDGGGGGSATRHLRIREGRVIEISETPLEDEAAEHLDCTGKWVMPGFLDIHTHYDAELLAAPGLCESVRHGVTTVMLGSCSLSTILCGPEDCGDLFARVEALPREFVVTTLAKERGWSSPSEYVEALESLPLGPNVACLFGHSDVRAHVMGLGRSVDPAVRPTEDELLQMEAHLESALDAGFVGLSTMTNPWDKLDGDRFRSAQLPSSYASWSEFRRLNDILRRRDRVHQGAPNITTKYNILLYLMQSAGWWLRKPLKTALITGADPKAEPFIAGLITRLAGAFNSLFGANFRWQSLPMPFEVYADGVDLVVFEEFGAGQRALHLRDGPDRDALLKDPAYREEFKRDYAKKWTPRVWHRDFYDATIVGCPDEGLVGCSFGEVSERRGQHPVDTFCDLVLEHGRAVRWRTVIANHRPDVHRRLLQDASVQIGFADSGAHLRNMAFYNFPLHLLRMARDAENGGPAFLSPERAVHRLTAELADWYGLSTGRLVVGARADIAVIDPAGLDASIDGYHEAPMPGCPGVKRMVRRNDRAVSATLVGGEVVYRNGRFREGYGKTSRTGCFLSAGQGDGSVAASSTRVA
jgi:N-acyl-D-aspartate/D-glutamate deacylase